MNKKTKTILMWAGAGIGLLGSALFVAFSSKNNDGKFSGSWLSNASDEMLNVEREKIRVNHCNGDVNARSFLELIDAELSKRAWNGKEYGYPVHREHGWYLSSDD